MKALKPERVEKQECVTPQERAAPQTEGPGVEIVTETWDVFAAEFSPDERIFEAFCFGCRD